ncbi:MAG: hypothetical protein KDI82_08430 [Gammaproteobacteria bacterium]|nr:hypothetical protein [Gammaproteobacteria bacterium]
MTYAMLAAGGLLLIGLAFMIIRSRGRRDDVEGAEDGPPRVPPSVQLARLKQSNRFWGFRIQSHCRASSRLAGHQYTFDELLPLPVEGCEIQPCACCLTGLPERRLTTDRRSGQDRRRSIRMEENERRAERPRRKADQNSWGSYSHL